MKKRIQSTALLIIAAVLLLTPLQGAAAAMPAVFVGTNHYISEASGVSDSAADKLSAVMPLASVSTADVTVSDYNSLIAAAAELYVARDTSFKIRYNGIGYSEASAVLSDDTLWEDIFLWDLPDTTSDLDYLHLNMRGTMKVSGWTYGTYAIFEFSQSFWTTAGQEAYVDQTVDAILGSLNIGASSPAGKIWAIHDYIVNNVTYDDALTRFSAYDALYAKKTVCNGYALLLYKMLLEAGVPVRAISGIGVTGGSSENHAWNIVKIGQYWYNIDATWDDSAQTTNYYLKNNANFSDHIRDSAYATDAFNAAYPMSPVDFDPSRDVTVIESISFLSSGGTYPVGTQFQLPVTVSPAGAAGLTLVWTSSDTGVAIVDSTGTVSVLGTGETVITAADGSGISASFNLTAVASNTPSDWAAAAVAALAARGVVPDELLGGYQTDITRGEFTALMVAVYEYAKGLDAPLGTPPFDDISGSLYQQQISKGYGLGIINGVGPTLFAPDGTLTREQCAKIICIAAALVNSSSISSSAALPYGDVASIQSWAMPYVQYAYENGLMNGKGTAFDPAGNLTREQAMLIAERMIEKYGW